MRIFFTTKQQAIDHNNKHFGGRMQVKFDDKLKMYYLVNSVGGWYYEFKTVAIE